MNLIFSIVVGALFGAGLYLILRRSLVKNLLGFLLLSYGVNFLIFVTSGMVRGNPPLIAEGQEFLPAGAADPLPQALLLTAIVIGFGVSAYFIVLCYRAYQVRSADDSDELRDRKA